MSEQLRALAQAWRIDSTDEESPLSAGYRKAMRYCADELDAAITPAPGGKVDNRAVEFPADLHPSTKSLVIRFASALAEKLHAAQVKYGYSDGWMRDDWMEECQRHLAEHVQKGDPRDVAAYCAFSWHHGWSTDGGGKVEPVAWRWRLRPDAMWVYDDHPHTSLNPQFERQPLYLADPQK